MTPPELVAHTGDPDRFRRYEGDLAHTAAGRHAGLCGLGLLGPGLTRGSGWRRLRDAEHPTPVRPRTNGCSRQAGWPRSGKTVSRPLAKAEADLYLT